MITQKQPERDPRKNPLHHTLIIIFLLEFFKGLFINDGITIFQSFKPSLLLLPLSCSEYDPKFSFLYPFYPLPPCEMMSFMKGPTIKQMVHRVPSST